MHIGIVLPNLGGGGAERSTLSLASGLAERGCRIDLLLLRLSGSYRMTIPRSLRLYYRNQGENAQELLEYCRGVGIEVHRLIADPIESIRMWPNLPRLWFTSGRSWSTARMSIDVMRFLSHAQPDLLFSALPRANDTAILATKLTNPSIPVVASIRNNVSFDYNERNLKVAQRLTSKADAVVAVSRGVAENAIEVL